MAFNQLRYEPKEKRRGYADLCALRPEWKLANPWLVDTPSQALQQSLKDSEPGFTNFSEKRVALPEFHKEVRFVS